MDAIIMKDNKQVVSFFKKLETMFEKIDAIKENARPLLNGERYMTDKELSLNLKSVEEHYKNTETMVCYLIFYLVEKYYIKSQI